MQVRSSRQNDKIEQWVMGRAIKVEVLESILGNKKKKFVSLFICPSDEDKPYLSVT